VEHQIRGLEAARLSEASLGVTTAFLEKAMGFRHVGAEGEWHRYAIGTGKSGEYLDVREVPDARRGAWGTGSIHHIAWRVDDDAHEAAVRSDVASGGAHPTPVIDRFWFKSVYFKEPGGVLFELATDGPGFAVDEDPEHLGETLVLPPWLEPDRGAIEAAVPPLTMPRR
jgi:glyoxalase family protein